MEPNYSERGRRAAVLSDPTRLRLLELLERADGPLDVATLADQVGVHHTSVRAHLGRLRDAGLVEARTSPAAGRGRPKHLYAAVVPRDAYRELSSLLAEAVRTGRSAREVGRDAGATAAARTPDLTAVDAVRVEAEALGFSPRRAARRGQVDLVLQHCPFRDVAAEDPATICSLHLGIAEGIAEHVGGAEVLGLVVEDPFRAGCRLQLRPEEVST